MRRLGYAIAVGLTLVATGPISSSPSPPVFDLGVCGPNATDIVVTDPDGIVLETWRGELRPGDTVRLGAPRLTLANTLPLECQRLRPEPCGRGWYRPRPRIYGRTSSYSAPGPPSMTCKWSFPLDWNAPTGRQFVLFLRKEGCEAGAAWMPAAIPWIDRREMGYEDKELTWAIRQAHRNVGFTTSVAWIEAGRILVLQASNERISDQSGPARLTPIALDYEHFKTLVQASPAPPRIPVVDARNGEIAPSFLMTVTGLSAQLGTNSEK